MSTPQAAAMKVLSSSVAPMLRQAGFRKRRHVFNRSADDGLVHVIGLTLAHQDPWGQPDEAWPIDERPPAEGGPGGYSVDVGVLVPGMRSVGGSATWVSIASCHLRPLLMHEVDPDGTGLWNLWEPDVEQRVTQFLRGIVLPWLSRFGSAADVLATFDAEGVDALGTMGAGEVDVASLFVHRGRPDLAAGLLDEYLARPLGGGHRDHVLECARSWGLDAVAERGGAPDRRVQDEAIAAVWDAEERLIMERGDWIERDGVWEERDRE